MDVLNTKLQVGENFLGKYHIVAPIGKGSGGMVFKANHTLMDKVVAIKTVLCNDAADRQEHLERLQLEARAASVLNHANLVTVHDYGELPNGNAYAVMDFVEGESLDEVLERERVLPYRRCLDISMQIAAGLQHAHERGVVHRDLKPRNIMLARTADGAIVVRVVDFGIAKLMPWSGKEGMKMTITGEIFGTPYYMSPELCSNKSTGPATDIYSLGCTMYEALVGISPAMDSTIMGVFSRHISMPAKPFKQVRPQCDAPPELEAVVMRALEKKPEDRFGSMGEMLEALRMIAGTVGGVGVVMDALDLGAVGMDRAPDLSDVARADKVEFLLQLAQKYESEKKDAEAEALYFAAIALIEKMKGAQDEQLCGPISKLAKMYYAHGRLDEAEAMYAKLLEVNN
jgi:serine/threonine protein kinase